MISEEENTMELHEAIAESQADPENKWFRPVSWRGTTQALVVIDGHVCQVPQFRGGVPHMPTNINALVGDWEVVTPDEVLEGQ